MKAISAIFAAAAVATLSSVNAASCGVQDVGNAWPADSHIYAIGWANNSCWNSTGGWCWHVAGDNIVWGSPIITNLTHSVDTSDNFKVALSINGTYTISPQTQQGNDTCVVLNSESYLQLGSCSNTSNDQKLWWINCEASGSNDTFFGCSIQSIVFSATRCVDTTLPNNTNNKNLFVSDKPVLWNLLPIAQSTAYPTSASTLPSSNPNLSAILGGSIGGICFVAVCLLAAFIFYRKRRQRPVETAQNPNAFNFEHSPSHQVDPEKYHRASPFGRNTQKPDERITKPNNF